MTVKEILKYIKKYKNYIVMSAIGWECFQTQRGGVYINHDNKTIILVQNIYEDDEGYFMKRAREKYGENVKILFSEERTCTN